MKKYVLLSMAGIVLFLSAGSVGAQCPEQPNDNGICDTFYVECYDSVKYSPPPWEVHFPLLVTSDVAYPPIDSIAGFTIPLRYTHTNPTAYCSLTVSRNNIELYPYPNIENSIFRHFGGMENRMMSLSERLDGSEWDTRIVEFRYNFILMNLVPTGVRDQLWWEGSRTLLATFTFLVEESMIICIDDTVNLPTNPCLYFSRSDYVTYIPRTNMPYCVGVQVSERGDSNGDGVINIADVRYMINYLYRSGPYPASFEAGDANCDGDHGILDVVILINFLYKGGRRPGCL
ncbi:MAG: dockerin type I repeat-containing protein [Candidatus Zixiibacteriota bacterium]